MVRFTVAPKPADFEERLEYRFENPTDNSVDVVLQWEKLAVSFPITVDTKAVVMASLKAQLRGLPRFGWQGWNQAAQLGADATTTSSTRRSSGPTGRSRPQANFGNLRTKAAILEKKGDTKQAEELRAQAMKIATEADINAARLPAPRPEEVPTKRSPCSARTSRTIPTPGTRYDSLGEALAAKGDTKAAVENYARPCR